MSAEIDNEFEFDFDVSPKDTAAAIFMGSNHRSLAKAFLEAKRTRGLTQKKVADALGVNKSVISRALKGQNNLTERTLAELCWAIGVEPELTLKSIEARHSNTPRAFKIDVTSKSTAPTTRNSGSIAAKFHFEDTKESSPDGAVSCQ